MHTIDTHQNRIVLTHTIKDATKPMLSPLYCYIDDLIAEKAKWEIDGLFLSINDLTRAEIRQLKKLNHTYDTLQDLIDERCADKYYYWMDKNNHYEED